MQRILFTPVFYGIGFLAYALYSSIAGPLRGWGLLLFCALVVIMESVIWREVRLKQLERIMFDETEEER